MDRWSLSTKIRVLVASVLLAFGGATLFAFSYLANRELESSIRTEAHSASKILQEFISVRESRLTEISSSVAKASPRARMLVFSADPATVQDQAASLASELAVDGVSMTDGTGALLGESDFPQSPFDPKIAKRALSTGGSASGVLLRGNHLYMVSCTPMLDQGLVKGTLSCYLSIGPSLLHQLSETIGTQVAVTRSGRVLASSLEGLPDQHFSDDLQSLEIGGNPYMALSQPMFKSGKQGSLSLVTLRNTLPQLRTARRNQSVFATILLVSLLASLAIGASFARNLVKPLDGLLDAARTVQSGNWPERFASTRADEIGLLQLAFNDMTDSVYSAQKRLVALADLDPLTELPNHRRFTERLQQEIALAHENDQPLSIAIIDIDRFSNLNRSEGHTRGDQVLKNLAESIVRVMPEGAIVSRYGGEEFAVLLPGADAPTSEKWYEKLQQTLREEEAGITVSIGFAVYNPGSLESEGLAFAAELALARAKQLGRNRVCSFEAVPGSDESLDPYTVGAKLQNGSLASVQALAAAVDAKDNYTRGHSTRVAEYASDLAKSLGDSEHEVERVYWAGTLHDVGKIGVPDEILRKPGRLSDEEARIMETHPVLGEMIVRKIPQLEDILPGVRHHHERWDGKGYPDRLAGTAIPRVARLLAVADTFDAMTSDRPYRKGMPLDTALDEIERMAGIQFDPEFAQHFVEMIRGQLDQQLAA